jgi:uncharacterized protein YybS (DUF2232 family)
MTKDLINGIAITGILVALSTFLPVMGFFFVLFVPLPTFFYRVKLGRRIGGIIPVAVACLVLVMAKGLTADALLLIDLLVIGFSLGEFTELHFPIEKIVSYATGVALAWAFACLFFFSLFSGSGMVSILSEHMTGNLEQTIALYEELEMPEPTVQLIKDSKERIIYFLVRITPGLMAVYLLMAAWLNLLLARSFFKAKNWAGADFGVLNEWKAPEVLVWFAIGSGVALFLPIPMLKFIGMNGLLVLMVVYFFQGMAIVAFFFEKKKLPKFLKIVLYVLIGIQQILIFFIIGLGFFDVWLDIRRLNPVKPEAS